MSRGAVGQTSCVGFSAIADHFLGNGISRAVCCILQSSLGDSRGFGGRWGECVQVTEVPACGASGLQSQNIQS